MRITVSSRQEELISSLTRVFSFKHDSVITRIAFTLSLNMKKKFDSDSDDLPSDGKEFRDARALFGNSKSGKSYYPVYKAMLDQLYSRQTSENEFSRLFKKHLNHGLEQISNNIENADIVRGDHVNYLANKVKDSINLVEQTDSPSTFSLNEDTKYPIYNGLVNFSLGEDETGDDVEIRLNDLDEFDSHHIAIAGMTGAGKTQLLKDILFQISKNTDNQLKYIFFDYKGEGNPDQLNKFLKVTNGRFVDLLKDDFNFNPLEFISNKNSREQPFQIQSFVDSIRAIEPKIGVKQSHDLKNILSELFIQNKIPELSDVDNALKSYYEDNDLKADSLISVVENLASGIFNRDLSNNTKIFDESLYLNLPITIADSTRQLCVFLILKYLLAEFSKAEDTSPEKGSSFKPLRYVIVIDEAHVYLNNKNARKILEDLLRVIRSKGVVIVLLTQGIEDFRKKDFDFSSQVKIPICLNIKEKNIKSFTNFLGTATSKNKFEKAVNSLENGKGIINFKEPELIDIRQFYKTAKNL